MTPRIALGMLVVLVVLVPVAAESGGESRTESAPAVSGGTPGPVTTGTTSGAAAAVDAAQPERPTPGSTAVSVGSCLAAGVATLVGLLSYLWNRQVMGRLTEAIADAEGRQAAAAEKANELLDTANRLFEAADGRAAEASTESVQVAKRHQEAADAMAEAAAQERDQARQRAVDRLGSMLSVGVQTTERGFALRPGGLTVSVGVQSCGDCAINVLRMECHQDAPARTPWQPVDDTARPRRLLAHGAAGSDMSVVLEFSRGTGDDLADTAVVVEVEFETPSGQRAITATRLIPAAPWATAHRNWTPLRPVHVQTDLVPSSAQCGHQPSAPG